MTCSKRQKPSEEQLCRLAGANSAVFSEMAPGGAAELYLLFFSRISKVFAVQLLLGIGTPLGAAGLGRPRKQSVHGSNPIAEQHSPSREPCNWFTVITDL